MTYGGRGVTPSGRAYRGGNNPFDKYLNVDPKDVEWLENTTKFKRVLLTPQLTVSAPAPAVPVEEVLPPTPAFPLDTVEEPSVTVASVFAIEPVADIEVAQNTPVQRNDSYKPAPATAKFSQPKSFKKR